MFSRLSVCFTSLWLFACDLEGRACVTPKVCVVIMRVCVGVMQEHNNFMCHDCHLFVSFFCFCFFVSRPKSKLELLEGSDSLASP